MLIAPGEIPVFVRRTERRERHFGIGSRESVRLRQRQDVRLQWLARLLGTHAGGVGDFESSLVVEWAGEAGYLESVANKRAELRKSFAGVLARCVAKGVLAEDAANGLRAMRVAAGR